eukprot:3936963-Rhodomonas_salina.1
MPSDGDMIAVYFVSEIVTAYGVEGFGRYQNSNYHLMLHYEDVANRTTMSAGPARQLTLTAVRAVPPVV